jgi:DNA-binding response OmpR family regulator
MQKVVIVNGTAELFDFVDNLLGAGHYNVVFVESSAHAYSQIRREHPNLVILCLELDDPGGFHVLSMLKMDEETRTIPLVTYTSEGDGDSTHPWAVEAIDNNLLQEMPAASMN